MKRNAMRSVAGPMMISTSSGTGQKVASEVALVEPRAETDFAVLQA